MSGAKGNQSCKKLKKLDKYGDQFRLSLDSRGTKQLSSVSGAITNILLKLVVVAYASYKLSFLLERKGVNIRQRLDEKHYTSSDLFTAKQGFFVAFSIDWNGPQIPPEIGNLEIIAWQWQVDTETGIYSEEEVKLETHLCTLEEMGLIEGEENRMFEFDYTCAVQALY